MTKVIRTWAPLAISMCALFVAAGGVSWAKSVINGKELKKNSIPLNRLTKKAQKALAGQQGPRGLKGDTGASGATHVVVRSETSTFMMNQGVNATESCDPGEVAVGGGSVSSDGTIYASGPVAANGGVPTAWKVGFVNKTGGTVTETASVVCASP